MKETWRTYPHNDNYEISTLGEVRRCVPGPGTYVGRILKPTNSFGYLYATLCVANKIKRCRIHKLVLETFVGDCPPGMECNHSDGNKANNKLNNLEWATSSDNKKHAFRMGLSNQVGERNNYSKLTERDIATIKECISNGCSQKEMVKKFNVTSSRISLIVNGKTWKHLNAEVING